jgi:uncharacterized protein (TIGR00369 family)
VTDFAPRFPDFAERVRRSFARQAMMGTIGASLSRVEPGEVEIVLPAAPHVLQQHSFVHGGAIAMIADSACGYAALSLMTASAGVLTAEFKVNFLASGAGERLIAVGRAVKPGRTLTVAQAEVHAEGNGECRLIALMTATLIAIDGRGGPVD